MMPAPTRLGGSAGSAATSPRCRTTRLCAAPRAGRTGRLPGCWCRHSQRSDAAHLGWLSRWLQSSRRGPAEAVPQRRVPYVQAATTQRDREVPLSPLPRCQFVGFRILWTARAPSKCPGREHDDEGKRHRASVRPGAATAQRSVLRVRQGSQDRGATPWSPFQERPLLRVGVTLSKLGNGLRTRSDLQLVARCVCLHRPESQHGAQENGG
jgi:hypothetical protein